MKNLFFVFLGLTTTLFSQWEYLNPYPSANTLRDIQIISDSIGIAVGDKGLIIRTTDNGENWSIQNSSLDYHLLSLHFADESTGYAAGTNGALLKTTDGGVSWNLKNTNRGIVSIYFTSENCGYAVDGSSCIKTIDGGETWVNVDHSFGTSLFSIHFIDDSVGFISGIGKIWKTMNGGLSWTASSGLGSDFYAIFFTDSSTGYAGGSGSIIAKTTDKGDSWVIKQPVWYSNHINSIYFFNQSIGYACADKGGIYKTTDGGESWHFSYWNPSNFYPNFLGVNFSTAETGLIVGAGGLIYKTINGGFTWSDKTKGHVENFSSVYFTDSKVGYISGTPDGKIWKTTNAGIEWEKINSGISGRLNSLFFTNSQIGFILGERSRILKTTDAGMNWTLKYSNSSTFLNSIHFTDQNIGFAVGKGLILKTTDAGENWSIMHHGYPTNEFKDVFCATASDIYIVGFGDGYQGGILKSSDGGNNWLKLNHSNSSPYNSVFFTSQDTGFIAGWHGKIFKTTDAGQSWSGLQIDALPKINDIVFTDSNNGYVVLTSQHNGNSSFANTTNGGVTWNEVNSIITAPLNSIHFPNKYIGFAVGKYGTIARIILDSIALDVKSKGVIPSKNYLHQNYPNPFNPTTTIQYAVPNTQHVQLKIYDVLGNEVAVLVDEEKSPGNYKVEFNASTLSSGVYFYKLSTGAFSETKKLIILK